MNQAASARPAGSGRARLQRFAQRAPKWLASALVIFDLLPILVLLCIAFVAELRGQGVEGGGLIDNGTFPAFDPLLWTAWIPVAIYVVLSLATIPLPLKRPIGSGVVFGRGMLLIFGILLLFSSLIRVGGFLESERFSTWGTNHIFVVLAVTMGIILLRIIAGWLRLVPVSWRREISREATRFASAGDATQRSYAEWDGTGRDGKLGSAGSPGTKKAFDSLPLILVIILLALLTLILLVIWATTHAGWAAIAMAICVVLMGLAGVALLLTYLFLVVFGPRKSSAGPGNRGGQH